MHNAICRRTKPAGCNASISHYVFLCMCVCVRESVWYEPRHFNTHTAKSHSIGLARILSGGGELSLVVALNDCLNLPQNISHVAKTVLKIDSCSGWGYPSCPGGALTHFSCKLGLKKKIFQRPGGVGAPTAPPGYAYVSQKLPPIQSIIPFCPPRLGHFQS